MRFVFQPFTAYGRSGVFHAERAATTGVLAILGLLGVLLFRRRRRSVPGR